MGESTPEQFVWLRRLRRCSKRLRIGLLSIAVLVAAISLYLSPSFPPLIAVLTLLAGLLATIFE